MKTATNWVWILLVTTTWLIPVETDAELRVTLGRYDLVAATTEEAAAQGWELEDAEKGCNNSGKFNGFLWVEKAQPSLGLLFNFDGDLSGIQMLINQKDLKNTSGYHFDQEPMYQISDIEGELYWTLTAYFVDPSLICATNTTVADDNRFSTTLYFQNGSTPQDLVKIPTSRSAAIAEGFSGANCFDGMGYHNFRHATDFKECSCTCFFPGFLLFENSQIYQGFGLWVMGKIDNASTHFEAPPGWIVDQVMGEYSTPCIVDGPTTTMHFFSNSNPGDFKCEN